jgi:hypothetical protein
MENGNINEPSDNKIYNVEEIFLCNLLELLGIFELITHELEKKEVL